MSTSDRTPVISVRELSKQYRLGEIGTGSLVHDLNRWWHKLRGKADPYATIDSRGPEPGLAESAQDTDFVWPLRNVSFEIAQGEVIGVIGNNGAGKSTLLKILSRVTAPTMGRIRIRGRVASLLEVGTGFHPELSGRDNIFLNGAIFGLRKREVAERLPAIIEFSGVEKYIDTPVKRYSSGMYVRLAFAVAAHLDPEILIVDEVLAVGDASFQRKCLGKMSDFSGLGRTILFVSHNMQAVRQLCSRVIWLENGRVRRDGPCEEVVEDYLGHLQQEKSVHSLNQEIRALPPDPVFKLLSVDILQAGKSTTELVSGRPVDIRIEYELHEAKAGFHIYFLLCDVDGSLIFDSLHNGDDPQPLPMVTPGRYVSTATLPADLLSGRAYNLEIQAAVHAERAFLLPPPSIQVHVTPAGRVNRAYPGYHSPGKITPLIPWTTTTIPAADTGA